MQVTKLGEGEIGTYWLKGCVLFVTVLDRVRKLPVRQNDPMSWVSLFSNKEGSLCRKDLSARIR